MEGFLLGVANGMTCLAFCAPVLVPFLLEQGKDSRRSALVLAQFLGGRLGGYLLVGLLAWATGSLALLSTGHQGVLVGAAYVGLSALLLVAVLRRRAITPGACALHGAQAWLAHWPALIPAGMGFLAGLRICPPLLLAFAGAANAGTLVNSLVFFLTFFLGTCVYFLPLPSLGVLARAPGPRAVGRFAAVIVALYYLYAGCLLIAGGVS
jgi:sulfite exporter TauE/SafE